MNLRQRLKHIKKEIPKLEEELKETYYSFDKVNIIRKIMNYKRLLNSKHKSHTWNYDTATIDKEQLTYFAILCDNSLIFEHEPENAKPFDITSIIDEVISIENSKFINCIKKYENINKTNNSHVTYSFVYSNDKTKSKNISIEHVYYQLTGTNKLYSVKGDD